MLLTDLVEQAVGESLLPALPVLTRSHLLLVGAVQDPQVRAWADGPVADADDAYRQAAAARTLRAPGARAACGATVVDAAGDAAAGRRACLEPTGRSSLGDGVYAGDEGGRSAS